MSEKEDELRVKRCPRCGAELKKGWLAADPDHLSLVFPRWGNILWFSRDDSQGLKWRHEDGRPILKFKKAPAKRCCECGLVIFESNMIPAEQES